jgi:EmrB/QacA subfamily drug resistance transporter
VALRDRVRPDYAVAAVFVAALFMSVMDSTVVNVAIPTLAHEFHAGNDAVEWVVIAYLLSLAVWMPASGWVGDRFGTKRVFLFALAIFITGSLLCSLATSLGQIVAFRVVQGVGGGMMTPVGTAMLFRAFPPARRARASQVLIVPTVCAPALGPIIGGFFVEQLSWRWVFSINIPIGLVAFGFGAVFLREHREERPGRFDLPGFVLSGSGLALVLYSLSASAAHGLGSVNVIASGLAGTLAFALLARVELRRPEPMLDLRLLANRLFRTCNLVCLFAYSSFLGLLFLMPLFIQEGRGQSPLTSGLTTFPEALGVLLSTQLVVGRIYGRVGPRRLMAGGLITITVLLASMALLQPTTSLWLIRALMLAAGAGMGFVILPQQAATFATVSSAATGRASAIYNTQRQTSGALGVAIMASALTFSAGRTATPSVSAFRVVFLVDAALALVGALVAFTIHDRDAASTMRVEPALAAEVTA